MKPDVILEARGIVRRYAGNIALKGVDFNLHRGAVNVLIGENGAGKSTLMRILSGVEQPDAGQVLLDGQVVRLRSPREATDHGIAIVHQELSVLPNMDVAENIFAGRELLRGGTLVDKLAEDAATTRVLERLRQRVAPARELAHLSLGARQMVELARAIAHGARILIMDEPTSALSTAETETLFQIISELKAAGVTIIYISHRLHELLHLGDHFTVFRSGEVAGEATRAEITRDWIVERMSGRPAGSAVMGRTLPADAPVILEARDLTLSPSAADQAAQAPLNGVHLTLRRGEILGVYGLLGAGRTELLEALGGSRKLRTGTIALQGTPVRIGSVRDAMRAGLVLVPEDRQRDGLVPELSIRENIALASPMLPRAQELEHVRRLVQELQIAVRDLELPVSALSGGSQQKVLLARCLMRSPLVLMLDEPTRGVDVGAKAEIYRTLKELASKGLSILFTSSEIEETQLLADRALVLCQGRIAREFGRYEMTDEALFAAASPTVSSADLFVGAHS